MPTSSDQIMPNVPIDSSGRDAMNPADYRLDSLSYHRNIEPILSVLDEALAFAPADALEIGSGSGQHITAFARNFPATTWWPSDPELKHRNSIAAWGHSAGLPNLMPPIELDASQADWCLGTDRSHPPSKLSAIICCNVFHIAPWRVTQGIIAGAGKYLSENGLLLTYGPYKRNGNHTTPSNESFDRSLRARNPQWGVRDINEIDTSAHAAGLCLHETVEMPANNLMLIFERDAA